MDSNMNNVLARLYYKVSNPVGYTGARGIVEHTKGKYNPKDVLKWLESQDTYTLHKPIKKKFKRNSYITNNIDQLWQADLNDMRGLSKYNDGINYILSVIDVFSKYGFMMPLKNKTNQCVKEAFELIFKTSGRKPDSLQTDKGSEFTGKEMLKFFNDNRINYFTSKNPDVKCGVIERWNKSAKTRMWRYLTRNNTHRYIDILQELVHSYNKTVHSTIKMCPADVNEQNILQVWKNTYQTQVKYKKPKYKVGDTVRIAKERKHFEKGYETKWSEELFSISKVVKHPCPVYELKDLKDQVVDGYYYEPEIQRVSIEKGKVFKIDKILLARGKGNSKKLLVKWKGYPSEFNSWISASQLTNI